MSQKSNLGFENENTQISKWSVFRKAKTGQFQNDLFSPGLYIEENENVRISKTKKICFRRRNQNTSFSPIYREEKNENELISLLSRLQVVGGLFIYFPTALYIEVDHLIIDYTIKKKICKANIDESGGRIRKKIIYNIFLNS